VQPSEPTAAAPSFLEKLGAEAIDAVIPLAQAEEAYVLAFVDGEIASGESNLGQAIVKALSAKIPLVGKTIGDEIEAELAAEVPTVEGAVKAAFDKAIALLQSKAKAWGG
jgi:hypothetical protein